MDKRSEFAFNFLLKARKIHQKLLSCRKDKEGLIMIKHYCLKMKVELEYFKERNPVAVNLANVLYEQIEALIKQIEVLIGKVP